MPAAPRWAWVPLPQGQTGPEFLNLPGGIPHHTFPPGWQVLPPSSFPNVTHREASDVITNDKSPASRSSAIKDESLKKRIRRQKMKESDKIVRQREIKGLKPYVVQVRASGIIDSGCQGHLRWQQFVRDITPRMLDMSVIKYDD